MAGSDTVARELVDFDRRLAENVLRLVARELGATEDSELPTLRTFLARLALDDEAAKSTMEWKAGFAHIERLRSLGLALAELLTDD